MSATPPAVFNVVAQQLTNAPVQTDEEILFQEALRNVQAKPHQYSMPPKVLAELNKAKTAEDVRNTLETARAASRVWKAIPNTTWSSHISKWADRILKYKVLFEAGAQAYQQIAVPVWGFVAFVLTILSDYEKTKRDLLERFLDNVKQAIQRFALYFRHRRAMPSFLRSSLIQFYEQVIEMSVKIFNELNKNTAVALLRVIHRPLKQIVDDGIPIIKEIIDNVDKNAQASGMVSQWDFQDDITQRWNNTISQPTIYPTSAIQVPPSTSVASISHSSTGSASSINSNNSQLPSTVPITATTRGQVSTSMLPVPSRGYKFTHGIPNFMSRCFQGQTVYLRAIYDALHNSAPGGQKRLAIGGIRGIGKTQILLRYAFDLSPGHAVTAAQPYDHIFWLNASEKPLLQNGLHSLASKLNLIHHMAKTDDPEILRLVQNWLHESENWLLVLDNVREFDVVKDVLPTGDRGHILFSSSHQHLPNLLCSEGIEPIEVKPMSDDSASALVRALIKQSPRANECPEAVVSDVVSWARGLPFAIEQLIKNSIFGGRGVAETLKKVQNKAELLRQTSPATLHEDNTNLGALVALAIEDLQKSSVQAAALFEVLIHFEPSSIPLDMLRSGASRMQTYLNRKVTFDRGTIRTPEEAQKLQEMNQSTGLKPSFWDHEPWQREAWIALRHRWRSKRTNVLELPLDDTTLDQQVKAACAPNKPLGRLLADQTQLDDAIIGLKNAWIVRRIDGNHLWMHDLHQELGLQLLWKDKRDEAKVVAQFAASMVYLSFPIPDAITTSPKGIKCRRYLPHGLESHLQLRKAGILNDSSLGPELSHILASTLWVPRTKPDGVPQPGDAERSQAIQLYRQALGGYFASWKRIAQMPGVQPSTIYAVTYQDFLDEAPMRHDSFRYVHEFERFGKHAPWRTLQTCWKLSKLLSDDKEELLQAAELARWAFEANNLIFGPLLYSTLDLVNDLYWLYMKTEQWNKGYEITRSMFHDLYGWDEKTKKFDKIQTVPLWNSELRCMELVSDQHNLSNSVDGAQLAFRAGECRSKIPGKTKESILWHKLAIKITRKLYDYEHYKCVGPMLHLARAFEQDGEPLACAYWCALAVYNALSALENEGIEYECGDPNYGRAPFRVLTEMENNTVKEYETAREKLGNDLEHLPTVFFGLVDSRISLWRFARKTEPLQIELGDVSHEEVMQKWRAHQQRVDM